MEDILRTLVAFPTVTGDKAAMHDLLDYVAEFVTHRGMHVTWFESNGFESIIATVKPGHKTPKVMLAAHADVVPAEDSGLFELRRQADRYLGRGVLDMKFAIAAYLKIIDDLRGNISDYDFGLMLTSDEEHGGANGTAKLIEAGYLPQVCILPDGGDNWQIQTSSKGMWAFEISAEGHAAHGSRPWMGDNAIIRLLGVLDEIAALFPQSPTADTNTITLSKMTGGDAMNQVPGRAVMTVDIRTTNNAEHHRLYDAIQAICRQDGISCYCLTDAVPTANNLNNPYIAPFARLIRQVTGIEVTGAHALGASDIRYYVPYGVPCISVYPTGGNHHADGEWIDCQALDQFADVLTAYLGEVARAPLQTD